MPDERYVIDVLVSSKNSQYSFNVRSHLQMKFHGDLDSGVLANVSYYL